jgi:CheY-like chemotaxis protein
MTVESTVGAGTTFRVYFPTDHGVAYEPPPELEKAGAGGGERLMYVDDEVALVTLFKLVLEGLGFEVSGHATPDAALEAFVADPGAYDLVITDLSMPGMSGIELARKMLAARADVPIVLMSGYMPEADIEVARSIGIKAFISKPASPQSLERTVEGLLQGRVRG